MASKSCLNGKWSSRFPSPLVTTFHGLWGTLLGKPSWNEPKTLKPYFSVWPNATGRGFDVSLLICYYFKNYPPKSCTICCDNPSVDDVFRKVTNLQTKKDTRCIHTHSGNKASIFFSVLSPILTTKKLKQMSMPGRNFFDQHCCIFLQRWYNIVMTSHGNMLRKLSHVPLILLFALIALNGLYSNFWWYFDGYST